MIQKPYLFSLVLFFTACTALARDIYLCMGQSNMAGRAPIYNEDRTPLDRVTLLTDSGTWTDATNPLNRFAEEHHLAGVGPAFGFAKTLSESFPDISIGLVVHAQGQTSLDQWLKAGEKNLRETALRRAKEAIALDKGNEIKAILWHQGESDERQYKTYIDRLKRFIDFFRKELDTPNLPFIVGQVEQWNDKFVNINRVLLEVPNHIPFTACVSSEGLTTERPTISGPHFDTPSQRLLGQRYAQKVIPLVYNRTNIRNKRMSKKPPILSRGKGWYPSQGQLIAHNIQGQKISMEPHSSTVIISNGTVHFNVIP